ncbi:phosphotransferase family protein [Paenibacillus hodogayensis]|uniref:Phosphotransferase family protein n=1 Tax=Paenibacillus hodogayensis TaxID=279208 RepID=A0ABV5VRF2_9BACL
MDLTAIREHIPGLEPLTGVQPISKGFSFDRKYALLGQNGQPAYVLRTATLKDADRKRNEFEIVRRVHETGVRTSGPVAFGTIEASDLCFMVLTYVDGDDASEALPLLTSDEQYAIGETAGSELRRMHELEHPGGLEEWSTRRLAKHKRQLEQYRSCGVAIPEEAAVLSFIEEHAGLMNGRPNRFQHDDFHPGNLLVRNKAYAGAIDFNRYDWGDPYHDFLKIAYFSRDVSVPFAIGQIDGYFGGRVPELFWKLYALYTAMIVPPTITWTLQVVPEQLDSMLDRIRVVLEDHRGFDSVVPGWYKP